MIKLAVKSEDNNSKNKVIEAYREQLTEREYMKLQELSTFVKDKPVSALVEVARKMVSDDIKLEKQIAKNEADRALEQRRIDCSNKYFEKYDYFKNSNETYKTVMAIFTVFPEPEQLLNIPIADLIGKYGWMAD